jgi:ABC-type nitrate/sulfonate/bicarbonate transport system substrate-binding protein
VNGKADLCIAPSESLISIWLSGPDKPRPIAIAAVLANDTSAIVTKKSSGFTSLKDLDWKRYASYEGRFEMAIVRQMIKNAGGQGNVGEVHPPKLDCFDAMLRDGADATWIFMGWEGIMALRKQLELSFFPVSGSGVPYGYSPLLIAHPHFLEDEATAKAFLEVTRRGYEYVIENPEDAASLFVTAASHPSIDDLGYGFMLESLEYLIKGKHFVDDASGQWGIMQQSKWEDFIHWLLDNKLLLKHDDTLATDIEMLIDIMFTNRFLPAST